MAARMSYRRPLIVAAIGIGLCLLWFLVWGLHIYWNRPSLINFLAAWIPFVLSVLFAFVPSGKEMKHQWIKWGWRGGVIAVGLFWSVMLWHQQALTDAATIAANQKLLDDAVTKSNNHADNQFGNVQAKVGDLGKTLDDRTKALGDALAQATGTINANIGKVGKPEPPEPAKLQFSLWKEGMLETEYPLMEATTNQKPDGSFQIQFMIKNISHVQAETVELWVVVCDLCAYAKEPEGFDNPPGNPKTVRHRMIAGLNPGTSVANTLDIKFLPAISGITKIGLGFKSTCKNCGAIEGSGGYVLDVTPALTLPQ